MGAPLIAVFGGGIPRRRLLLGLMAVFTVGNLLSALAFGFPTLLAARFFAGLPHGAFFGVASLVAAELSPPDRRARAVARILLGLAIANVGGVPLATWLGQTLGWRSSFGLVAVVTGVTFTLIRLCVPQSAQPEPTTGARALRALLRPGVLLLLGAAAVGLGGMFAVYSYITPTLTHRAGLPSGAVPGGHRPSGAWGWSSATSPAGIPRRPLSRQRPVVILTVFAAFLAVFAVVSTSPVGAVVGVFTIGTSFAIVPCLQSRLMDVAADAQTLAAAGNDAAGNLANALGAWLGGVAIDLGGGWHRPGSASPWLRPVCCSLPPHGPNGGRSLRRRSRRGVSHAGATKSAGKTGMPPRGPYRILARLYGSARDLTQAHPASPAADQWQGRTPNRALLDEVHLRPPPHTPGSPTVPRRLAHRRAVRHRGSQRVAHPPRRRGAPACPTTRIGSPRSSAPPTRASTRPFATGSPGPRRPCATWTGSRSPRSGGRSWTGRSSITRSA